MALINDIKALDIGALVDGGVFLRVAAGDADTTSMDIAWMDGVFLGMETGEEEPPPEPGLIQRYFPGLPPERTFPPLHVERTFPL
jgi:hypothetical protein